MTEFQHGPFVFTPGRRVILAGVPSTYWNFEYDCKILAERALSDALNRSEVVEAFSPDRVEFERGAKQDHAPDILHLVDSGAGDTVASIHVTGSIGLSPGLIDDRSQYWLRSADGRRSRDVTLAEFGDIACKYSAPSRHWITGLFGVHLLSENPEAWRAPTSWELRHVVGEGSFTGVTGAAAAELVGVTPQNFRKYTARDDAKNRQSISFAMWHLLLHRLDIKRIGSAA